MSLLTAWRERALPRVDRRGIVFTASAVVYATLILSSAWTLNPYFAQTWDVVTFVHAAQSFLGGTNPFDLYAQSRAAQTWPYAYPPLHAMVVAAALLAGKLVPALPDYVVARVPAVLADIGIALALYRIVERKTSDENLARTAFLVWLFNPVTFYNTAVQGHFESEWLLPVLLAYLWVEESPGIVLPSLALGLGVLFKQVAILFAIPVWMAMAENLFYGNPRSRSAPGDRTRAGRRLAASLLISGAVIGVVVLPFLLYSNDFLYMNLTYVENVPVQTQSWMVALLGITRSVPNAFTSDFLLFRYQTFVTLLAAAAIAFIGVRRRWSLYLVGTLIALAFFLTSKKVMGYYYVMLLPFLLVECLPRRRLGLVLAAVVATTWIALSPYYAAWANPAHWWIYAVLGAANSVFFAWLGWQVTAADPPGQAEPGLARLLFVTVGLFAAAVLAALAQPVVQSAGSAIRAPVVAPGMQENALVAGAAFAAVLIAALVLTAKWTRKVAGSVDKYAFALVLTFAPLFFAVYTLTKESTALFEIVINALGG